MWLSTLRVKVDWLILLFKNILSWDTNRAGSVRRNIYLKSFLGLNSSAHFYFSHIGSDNMLIIERLFNDLNSSVVVTVNHLSQGSDTISSHIQDCFLSEEKITYLNNNITEQGGLLPCSVVTSGFNLWSLWTPVFAQYHQSILWWDFFFGAVEPNIIGLRFSFFSLHMKFRTKISFYFCEY